MRLRSFWVGLTAIAMLGALGGCPVEQDGTDGTGDSSQGIPGPAGADGAQGAPGAPGADGADGAAGPQGPVGLPGEDGEDGADGLSCWDLNGNGAFDAGSEDANGNGVADAGDCQGAQGPAGPEGQAGADGADGADGAAGQDGLHCWDLNGDGVFDAGTEDLNGNGVGDAGDCKGEDGSFDGTVARGTVSASGTWDVNDGLGILEVENTTPGLYVITLAVDNSGLTATQEDYAVIVTIQQPAPPALLFASWEFVSLSETELVINVRFRNVNATGVNTAFSLLVLGP